MLRQETDIFDCIVNLCHCRFVSLYYQRRRLMLRGRIVRDGVDLRVLELLGFTVLLELELPVDLIDLEDGVALLLTLFCTLFLKLVLFFDHELPAPLVLDIAGVP